MARAARRRGIREASRAPAAPRPPHTLGQTHHDEKGGHDKDDSEGSHTRHVWAVDRAEGERTKRPTLRAGE